MSVECIDETRVTEEASDDQTRIDDRTTKADQRQGAQRITRRGGGDNLDRSVLASLNKMRRM
jgi:hypothetical protein